jgi:hypothetical protein
MRARGHTTAAAAAATTTTTTKKTTTTMTTTTTTAAAATTRTFAIAGMNRPPVDVTERVAGKDCALVERLDYGGIAEIDLCAQRMARGQGEYIVVREIRPCVSIVVVVRAKQKQRPSPGRDAWLRPVRASASDARVQPTRARV